MSNKNVLKFTTDKGFVVVLEFSGREELDKNISRIEAAGLKYELLSAFRPQFDHADLFMDMRSPECAAQFDLEDWL